MKVSRIVGISSIALLAGTSGYLLESSITIEPTQRSCLTSVRDQKQSRQDLIARAEGFLTAALSSQKREDNGLLDKRSIPTTQKESSEKKVDVELLPKSEQQSLWTALSEARHTVTELIPEHAAMATNEGVLYFASQPRQDFTVRFLDDGGVRLQPGYAGADWMGTLHLAGQQGMAPQKTDNARVEIKHSSLLVEWYENKPEGLEHGFIVHSSAADMDEAKGLQIKMDVQGMNVKSDPSCPGNLVFAGESDEDLMGYQDLKVWDAKGAKVSAAMYPEGNGFMLTVNDTGASYPLTIDPLIVNLEHAQKVSPEGGITLGGQAEDYFAESVALAGNIAVIGAPHAANSTGGRAGSVYIFQRVDGRWSLMQKLISDQVSTFGESVALSGDSLWSTLVVGAPGYQSSKGRAMVYRLTPDGWIEEKVLFPTDSSSLSYTGAMEFGKSVSVSGDSVLVGAPGMANNRGWSYIFSKISGSWTQDHKMAGGYSNGRFGEAVALSEGHVMVGAPNSTYSKYINGNWVNYTNAGMVYCYRREDGNLISTPTTEGPHTRLQLGSSLAISGDTAVAGSGEQFDIIYVYSLSGSGGISGAREIRDDDQGTNGYGTSVAIDGDTIVVGAHNGNASGTNGAGAAYVYRPDGSTWSVEQVIYSSDAELFDTFGAAVAVSEDSILVGSPYNGTQDESAKGATVFTRITGGWGEQQKLDAVDAPSADDLFGHSVAISGDTMVVGAYGDDTPAGPSAGSAYIFTSVGGVWAQQGRLVAVDGAFGDTFGYSVAISGETIAVGAHHDDTAVGTSAGSAYIYERVDNLWRMQQKLEPDDASNSDSFGFQVDISDDSVAVGSLADKAYVFTRVESIWSQQQMLQSDDLVAGDSFGGALAIEGDFLVVGSKFDDTTAGIDTGSSYVFFRSAAIWSQQQKLVASDASTLDYFGNAVDISGDAVVVGAYSDSTPSRVNTGSAYVFVRSGSTWTEQQKLVDGDSESEDEFGSSVAIVGDYVLIGAPKDDWWKTVPDQPSQFQSAAGSAYVFSRVAGVWNQQRQLMAPDGEAGDFFGKAVAVSENAAVVGAYVDDGSVGVNEGSVHVFQIQKINLSSLTFSEDIWPIEVIANLTVGDSGVGWTFSLVDGVGSDDNALFRVPIGYDALLANAAFDYEQQSTRIIRVRAHKPGTTLEDTFTLTLLDDRTEDADGDGLTEAQEEDIYGISDTNPDDDGDGIPGGTEVSLGLSPVLNNSDLVDAIQSKPTEFGVDMDALSLGQPMLMKAPDTGKFTLVLDLKKSTNLSEFVDMAVRAAEISVNAEGNVEVTFESPDAASFYRIEVK